MNKMSIKADLTAVEVADYLIGCAISRQRHRQGIHRGKSLPMSKASVEAVIALEAGLSRPSSGQLLAVSDLLGCAVSVFFEDPLRGTVDQALQTEMRRMFFGMQL